MAIDDPIDAFEQQYMKDEPELPEKLAKYAAGLGFKLAMPDGGLAADILVKVVDALFDKPSGVERVRALFELVSGEFKNVERTKASHEDVQKAIQTVQIAIALGQATESNLYTREIGYGICCRLQGFGLAHEIGQSRELPLTNYTFRLSTQGIRLLKLLGENVPNYDYYFKPAH